VICSDGVTEARNAAGEEFGRERLIEAMTGCHGAKPDAVLERLFGAVRTFSQGTPQGDDITGLVLRYRGHPNLGPDRSASAALRLRRNLSHTA
jgi:phosphoserine phosphatase RsbU/P